MFDSEPAFCCLVVSHFCTVLCCAITCDTLKSALLPQCFLKWDSWWHGQEFGVFTVLGKTSSIGSHPLRKISANLSIWERVSGATRSLCSKTLWRRNPDSLAKAGVERESVERKKGWSLQSGFEPCKYSATSLPCKIIFSSSLPKNVMWQHSIFSCMSEVLSLFAEARLFDCSAIPMKWCVLVKTKVWLFSDKISELVHNNPV